MRLQPASAALVVIDAQRAFCAPDGSVAQQGRDVSACAAALAACRDLVEAWRRRGLPVVWTRMGFQDDYRDAGLLVSSLRPGIAEVGGLRWGTDDVELMLEPQGDEPVVDKARFSALVGTGLIERLERLGATDLVVAGVTTSMCVESTVRDAGQRDYRVFVIEDAVGDLSGQAHLASLRSMAYGFANVLSRAELEARLDAVPLTGGER